MKPIEKFWFDEKEQRLYISSTIPKEMDSTDAGHTETYTIDKKGFTLIEHNGKKSHVGMTDFIFAMIDYIIEGED
jgi:hypothetical protein